MAEITRLHGSPHEQTQRLLPWFNNGTLNEDEATMVESHLAECAECRSELSFDNALRENVAGLRLDVEHGWAAFENSIGIAPAGDSVAAETGQIVRPPFWRRRVPVGWMVGGQAAAALLVFAAFNVPGSTPAPKTYHALGAAAQRTDGNVVIMFDPKATELQMRDALTESSGQIIDGPNASGAYVLHVPADRRREAISKLRARSDVVLAEPIGAESNS